MGQQTTTPPRGALMAWEDEIPAFDPDQALLRLMLHCSGMALLPGTLELEESVTKTFRALNVWLAGGGRLPEYWDVAFRPAFLHRHRKTLN